VLLGTSTQECLDQGTTDEGDSTWTWAQAGRPPLPSTFHLGHRPTAGKHRSHCKQRYIEPNITKSGKPSVFTLCQWCGLFASPCNLDIDHLHRILNFFVDCLDLRINIFKTEIFTPSAWTTAQSCNYFKIFPENLQLPQQISRSPPSCQKTKENWCATLARQDWCRIAGVEPW
jgi:hypothetical protein